ncbi:MAG: N-acyl homoserine lactonase family protein [Myxococcota bacterium]
MNRIGRRLVCAGLLLALSGCEYVEGVSEQARGLYERAQALYEEYFGVGGKMRGAKVRLQIFDCGRFTEINVRPFSLFPYEVALNELFVPCYLVEHAKGKLLWDAGLPPWILGKPEGVKVQDAWVMYYDSSLADQLKAVKLNPWDITHVAFSHMHFDHVGSANLFTGATHLIQKLEYDAAFADPPPELFQRELYERLERSKTVKLDGDHDVFGDGRVLILSTPGHTPGHQVLFLDLGETGPIVLSGDLYHFPESYDLRRVPEFNSDRGQTLASMDRVEEFLEKRNAELWIQHDMESAKTLKMSPKFYE